MDKALQAQIDDAMKSGDLNVYKAVGFGTKYGKYEAKYLCTYKKWGATSKEAAYNTIVYYNDCKIESAIEQFLDGLDFTVPSLPLPAVRHFTLRQSA